MTAVDFIPQNHRERMMWRVMTARPRFRYVDVERDAQVSRYYVDNFAAKLRQKGLIRPAGRVGQKQYFTVLDDKDEASFDTKKKGDNESRMWTAMRSLVTFTWQDVLVVVRDEDSSLTEGDIQRYCTLLMKASYVAVVQKARVGINPARYRLVNDTGPMPPIERTVKVLVDGNLGRAVYSPKVEL